MCQCNAVKTRGTVSCSPTSPEFQLHQRVKTEDLLQNARKRQWPWIQWNCKWKLWINDRIHSLCVRFQSHRTSRKYASRKAGNVCVSSPGMKSLGLLGKAVTSEAQSLVPKVHTHTQGDLGSQKTMTPRPLGRLTTLTMGWPYIQPCWPFLYFTFSPEASHRKQRAASTRQAKTLQPLNPETAVALEIVLKPATKQ